jgi:hypothetical protein
VLAHRPDLPILPGNAGNLPLLGLGLWQFPTVSALVELALVLAGAYLYHRRATALPTGEGLNPAEQRRRVLTATGVVTGGAILAPRQWLRGLFAHHLHVERPVEQQDEQAGFLGRRLMTHRLAAWKVRICPGPDDLAVAFQPSVKHHDRVRRGVPVKLPSHARRVADQVVLLAGVRVSIE